MKRTLALSSSLASLLLVALSPGAADARPGRHAPAFSTWDTRASSVVFPQFMYGSLGDGGHLSYASYNANFSATNGNLSAQFGLHYANLREGADAPTLYGASGSATAVFSVPVADRYDNGVPKVALGAYVGSVPTVLISGPLNYMSVPLDVGVGVPVSPAKWLTIAPWGELSPSYDIDSRIDGNNVDVNSLSDASKKAIEDALRSGNVDKAAQIASDDAKKLVSNIVQLDRGFHVGFRGGLQIAAHLDDDVSLQANLMAWQLGGYTKATVIGGGGALLWRWDDIVPAVLPAETRLLRESCEAVSERFRMCPQYRDLGSGGAKSVAPPAPGGAELAPAAPSGAGNPAPAPSAPPAPGTAPAAPQPAAPAPAPGALPPMPGAALN